MSVENAGPQGQAKQTMGFQTEVKQLLQLMIHSLYSNHEIFLRELISNASDACDKLRYEALSNGDLYEGDGELKICISMDEKARTLSISDNGIGMSREEVIDNLGTIARSGTKEFFGKLSGDNAKDSQLIGQFGVGFYSAFIVADKVTVRTRRAGAAAGEATLWESDGSGEFSVEGCEKASRGTEVILHLRTTVPGEEGHDYDNLLQDYSLRGIISKYSDHISLPIEMQKRTWDSEAKAFKIEDTWESVNKASALWARNKSEIDEAQYFEFYKNLTGDSKDPLAYSHNRLEGRTEYTQLLYVPGTAPYDIFDRENRRGLKLYVKRVFILDDAQQLLPVYLRFVRGIVDSADLPLNVSREILQESRDVKAIREGCTKRVLSMLEDLAENHKEKYASFWKEFGQVLKEGLGEDFGNAERLQKLLRFASTQSEGDDQSVSLAYYVSRMKEGQDKIYYVTAENLKTARMSPHLEGFRKKGIEVLLLTERIDEWMLSYLQQFEDKELVSVARGSADLGKLEDEEEKKQNEAADAEFKDTLEAVKTALGEQVKDVRVSKRLTDSASCLVSDEGDISANLERMLKQAGQKAPDRKPILELNPTHPIVLRMKAEIGQEGARTSDWASLLFDQAILSEGGQLQEPALFVKRMNDMLLKLSA
jgi:molecular chaperone HtpG